MCEEALEVRYKLDGRRGAEVLRSAARSLADGRLHAVSVRRRADGVSLQVTQRTQPPTNTVTRLHIHVEPPSLGDLLLPRERGQFDSFPTLGLTVYRRQVVGHMCSMTVS